MILAAVIDEPTSDGFTGHLTPAAGPPESQRRAVRARRESISMSRGIRRRSP